MEQESVMKEYIGMGLVFLVVCAIGFGSAMYAKRFSYWMWYEDMVKQTVVETLEERGL